MNPLPWRRRVTPLRPSRSWTSPAPTPRTTRARPKTRLAESLTRTSRIDPNAAAATRPTTLTWSAPHRDVILSVKHKFTTCVFHLTLMSKTHSKPFPHFKAFHFFSASVPIHAVWIYNDLLCFLFLQVTLQENTNAILQYPDVLFTIICLQMSARWVQDQWHRSQCVLVLILSNLPNARQSRESNWYEAGIIYASGF